MLNQAALFLVQTVLGLLSVAFLLRFYFQWCKVSFQHPIAQLLIAMTNFAVKPTRKIVPSIAKLDISTLLLAYLTQLLLITLGSLLFNQFKHAFPTAIWLAVVEVVKLSGYIFMGAVFLQAIVSWVNPYSPIAPLLHQLTMPVMRPLRSVIPNLGGVDFSSLVFIIMAQFLLLFVLTPIETYLFSVIQIPFY
ncbi:MAG: YggT family protein [Methylotenera sp.]|nr:YggT family protein [Methylotenera sp.]